jgi:hypothetical protein
VRSSPRLRGRRGGLWPLLGAALLLAGCAPAQDADKLFNELVSPDLETRQDAADRIEQVVEAGDYRVFVRGLDSTNLLNRAQSIVQLARISRPEAQEALRALLVPDRRMMLPFNPIRLRPQREPSDSRILVASLIRRGGGDPQAIGVLLAGAEEGRTAEVLEGTCFAVGALQDPAGIPFLEKAAGHPDLKVARAAVQALGQFRGPEAVAVLGRLIGHAAFEVRSDVLTSLSANDDEATKTLLRTIGESDPMPELRAGAFEALSRFRDADLVPYFIARLKDAPDPARASAAEALARITGQALGSKPGPWEQWLAKNRPGASAGR